MRYKLESRSRKFQADGFLCLDPQAFDERRCKGEASKRGTSTLNAVRALKAFSASSGSTKQGTLQKHLRQIWGLPIVLKVAIVVVGVLLLLTVLSPLGLTVALLLFGVSLIGLIVRLA